MNVRAEYFSASLRIPSSGATFKMACEDFVKY
jgi:hypothetical protein